MMKKIHTAFLAIAAIGAIAGGSLPFLQAAGDKGQTHELSHEKISLPDPKYDSSTSVESALRQRRSVRDYADEPLTLSEVSQLLWAAQGVTDLRMGFRTAPSAGALYPLEIYAVIGNVSGLAAGIYKYEPHAHALAHLRAGDVRQDLAVAALGQTSIQTGAIALIFSAVYERTTRKYGERGVRYVHIEVGHAAQNVYLQAVSLNLGAVVIGAFQDTQVKTIVNMRDEENPLYIMPVGKTRM
ncbi:nitroreductase family protein [Candidatus Vecturithrix granuli]|uniref:Nitroreductase family protein n=1 Tax=Vecturithrix granuli TaxID=1499967 RepID=A0A0S6W7E0_VECG1|nr:nitroreductase family protein [Candidatus Vecturithrix granuli]